MALQRDPLLRVILAWSIIIVQEVLLYCRVYKNRRLSPGRQLHLNVFVMQVMRAWAILHVMLAQLENTNQVQAQSVCSVR